mgnify:CR=1 FL=1
MGFCRTNLFKRLESSGIAFIQSLERHILRNYIYLHAIENGEDIPIGTQDAELLDTRNSDEDSDSLSIFNLDAEAQTDEDLEDELSLISAINQRETAYRQRASEVYELYRTKFENRFRWLRPTLFKKQLKQNLLSDARALIGILSGCGEWDATHDQTLNELVQ